MNSNEEIAKIRTLSIMRDAMHAEMAECVGANEARLVSIKMRLRSRRNGKRKFAEHGDYVPVMQPCL